MKFERFSPKQLRTLTWWCDGSPYRSRDAIICDGAVRSGKTLCLTLSFAAWAMCRFDGRDFALCGKTILSLRRNAVTPLTGLLPELGFRAEMHHARNLLTLTFAGRSNRFHLFGGRDESSAALIQGITLAGVLFDEVALMPRSFVEQALARCSVEGSKFWFNCNPEYPGHWFYKEWICRRRERNALYMHFTMEDNPSLSPQMRARYRGLYAGAFYDRFIKGEWTAPVGLVYPMFGAEKHVAPAPERCERYVLSCDYGTVNPTSVGLWGMQGGVWYRVREYYYDARAAGQPRTDGEHYRAMEALAAGTGADTVVIDPSAASLIALIRREGRFRAVPARNEVLPGIAAVSAALKEGRIRFDPLCKDILREFGLYRWDESGRDEVRKEDDHAMDDMRYFVATVMSQRRQDGFYVRAVER